ncbi:MAG: ribbon-helix-helix domain-containing protein [Candidatus Limnocylindrales bacterium]|jgi:Arc/MetJ-type ribon-helix-helix transcriptional regulator
MKVSVSLPGDDIEFLNNYVKERGLGSRSAALQQAIRLLRTGELSAAYEAAWDEWAADADNAAWDEAVRDGLPR